MHHLSNYRKTIKPLARRAAFGLPIIQNEKQRKNKNGRRDAPPNAPPSNQTTADLTGRRASPLLLHVSALTTPTGQTDYVAVATLFKSQFQPVSDEAKRLTSPPDYRSIEQWIATNFPNGVEVEL